MSTEYEKRFYEAVKTALNFDLAQVDATIRSARGVLTKATIDRLVTQRRYALMEYMRGFHDEAMIEARVLIVEANGIQNALAVAPRLSRDNARQNGTRKKRRPEINEWIAKQLKRTPDVSNKDLRELAIDSGEQWEVPGEDAFYRRIAKVRKNISIGVSK